MQADAYSAWCKTSVHSMLLGLIVWLGGRTAGLCISRGAQRGMECRAWISGTASEYHAALCATAVRQEGMKGMCVCVSCAVFSWCSLRAQTAVGRAFSSSIAMRYLNKEGADTHTAFPASSGSPVQRQI